MNTPFSGLRLARAGIFLLLAILVVFLGAAAKHSQFEGSPQHNFLSKATKMAGARIDPSIETDSVWHVTAVDARTMIAFSESAEQFDPAIARFTFVPLLSTPLRI